MIYIKKFNNDKDNMMKKNKLISLQEYNEVLNILLEIDI
jgi:hypothetical protein